MEYHQNVQRKCLFVLECLCNAHVVQQNEPTLKPYFFFSDKTSGVTTLVTKIQSKTGFFQVLLWYLEEPVMGNNLLAISVPMDHIQCFLATWHLR